MALSVPRLDALWRYRGFVLSSVVREIRGRYRGSLLGAAWIFIGPLVMILIYTLVFSRIMQARLPGVTGQYAYSLYLCAGLLPWGFFAEVLQRTQGVFLDNANLIKKANFPRIALPLIILLGGAFNLAVVGLLFLVFLLAIGAYPGWPILAAIPPLILLAGLASAGGLLLGVLNIFYRDVGQIVGVGLQLLFWLTPIVYPIDVLPEKYRHLIELNPLVGIVGVLQAIFIRGQTPDFAQLLYPAAWVVTLTLLAALTYRRLYTDMIDEL